MNNGSNPYSQQKTQKVCLCCREIIKDYPSEMARRIFCSRKCRSIYAKKNNKRSCKYCNNIFYINKNKNQRFCSRKCGERNRTCLDYSKMILDKHLLEYLDGLILSDGHISKKQHCFNWGFKHKEFSNYLVNIFKSFHPITYTYKTKQYKYLNKNKLLKSKNSFRGNTKSHPDIKNQRKRWYPNGKKLVPKDINITSKSVLLWYLGDGSLNNKHSNVQLCTDSFTENCINILIKKLNRVDIYPQIRFNNEHQMRLIIHLNSLRRFFDFIGWESPVKCYDYKFNIPNEIRYSKSTKEVSKKLNVNIEAIWNIRKKLFPNKTRSINHSYWWSQEEIKLIRSKINNQ